MSSEDGWKYVGGKQERSSSKSLAFQSGKRKPWSGGRSAPAAGDRTAWSNSALRYSTSAAKCPEVTEAAFPALGGAGGSVVRPAEKSASVTTAQKPSFADLMRKRAAEDEVAELSRKRREAEEAHRHMEYERYTFINRKPTTMHVVSTNEYEYDNCEDDEVHSDDLDYEGPYGKKQRNYTTHTSSMDSSEYPDANGIYEDEEGYDV